MGALISLPLATGLILLGAIRAEPPGSPLQSDAPGELAIVEEHASDWSIVVPDAATPVELEAAAELARFVQLLTGAELPVLREAEAPAARRVLIGATRAAGELVPDRAALGEDGFAIRARRTSAGGELALVGGLPEGGPHEALGTLYAVYHLLEDQLGCRFWAPDALEIPVRADVRIPADLDLRQVPAVWFRHVNYGPARDPAYRRWHKLDSIQAEVGRLWAPHWVHSVFEHVPPAAHFAQHPEYYSLVGGERRASQLCLTQPDVLALTVESVRRVLAEHPDVRYVSISQEDNYEACQCADARRLNAREGTQMGELLTFVNAVAAAFPERVVSTLAYQYSRKPPKTLRPRDNVSIMLCTIEEDRSRPIADNPESDFPADFEGWCAISDDVFLWDYEVQFASPMAPFPNLRVLQPNVRWFAENGVRHLFLQGNGLHTELAELRCYLLAKLAWDAEIDVEATTDEFLRGYYGAAAPHLRAYLDLLHDELAASGEPLLIYGHPALAKDSWLRAEVRAKAREHLERASRAAAGDPTRLERVRTASLPLMYAELEIAKRAGAAAGGIWTRDPESGGWRSRPAIRALLSEFLAGCETAGIERLRERDLTRDEYRAAWERLFDVRLPEHRAFGRAVEADPPPSSKYADGEVPRLTDGLPGGDLYHENWVGWEGTDARIVLDLGAALAVERLELSALQDPKSWIWLPVAIEVEASADGTTWSPVARLVHERPERAALVHRFEATLASSRARRALRYLRLSIDARETCPPWHLGAGRPAWFFVDELRVE